jgi:hypothetical protein
LSFGVFAAGQVHALALRSAEGASRRTLKTARNGEQRRVQQVTEKPDARALRLQRLRTPASAHICDGFALSARATAACARALAGAIASPSLLPCSARWRGGRAAEGARLESVYAGNRIAGSNPAPSANPFSDEVR